MEVYDSLSETLKKRPFVEQPSKRRFQLNSQQCEAVASHVRVVLLKFFGRAVLTQPSLQPSLPTTSRPWNTVSALYSKRLSKWWFMPWVNRSSAAVSDDDSFSLVLEELKMAPQGLEDLYRVIKEAENFLTTCSNRKWRSAAVALAATAEARDVHIHDLVWCSAGLSLALNSIRCVELESRAEFCRLGIAACYARLEALSAGNSDLVRKEEQDHKELLSKLQEVKQSYDGRNIVRRQMSRNNKTLNCRTADFLLQKLTLSETNLESDPFAAIKPPQSMQIRKEDLDFPSPPRLIGRGSYASVYEVFWLGKKVAAKAFPYDACKDLFESEAGIHAELRCPFIVQLIGWCEDIQNNVCYLVSELVNGNLQNFVINRTIPLRLPVVIDSMLQISRGMEYLHSRRILHRDLKPSNILVEPLSSCKELEKQGYGRIRICDFGLARMQNESHGSMTSKVGTLCYMAPEIWPQSNGLDRVEYSLDADVYSFSMTFAFMLTGIEPFKGITTGNALMNTLRQGVRPELPSNCPKLLKELIQKCWSQNPSSRPSFSSISMTLRHLKLLLMEARPEQRLECLLDHKVFPSTPAVSYHDISKATNGFTRKPEYINVDSICHGVLYDGTPVLVYFKQGQADQRNIWGDISKMLSLRHGNIVQVQAVCIHHTKCWFLYKHACVQRSLDTLVDTPVDIIQTPLDGKACFRIAVGVANGLQYLHARNIRFSVTTKNILVDERFEPQLLVHSPLCEEKNGLKDEQRRSDVSHFNEVIDKLLLHLSSNRLLLLENTRPYSPALILKEVERACRKERDITMIEVIEMLETHISDIPEREAEYPSEILS